MVNYCEVCEKEVEVNIVTRKEKYKICGEDIEVEARVAVCAECGEEIFNEELDSQTLLSAYNAYRRKHKLLLPEEIRAIREQYGLSQRSFAKLLNWGDKTIHRYENGALQDRAHNSLLLLLRNPQNMKAYLSENEVALDDRQKMKLLDTVKHLEQNLACRTEKRLFESLFANMPVVGDDPKEFDYEKFCAWVLVFANEKEGLSEEKIAGLERVCEKFKEYGDVQQNRGDVITEALSSGTNV